MVVSEANVYRPPNMGGLSICLFTKKKSVQKYERGGLLRPPLYEDFGVKGVILTEKLGNIRVKRKKTGCQIGVK